LPAFYERGLNDSLRVIPTVEYMWIDDTSADVIKVDFDALYHGDVLVEGDTSEQLDDEHPLPTAV
jgi:hypothetical protein